jgi:hypothetical protein
MNSYLKMTDDVAASASRPLLGLRDVSEEWCSQGRRTLLDHSVKPVEFSSPSSWKELGMLEGTGEEDGWRAPRLSLLVC